MNMNNLTHTLVDYYDVGSFQTKKYSNTPEFWACNYMIGATNNNNILRDWVVHWLDYKAALQIQKNIATISATMTCVLTTYEN